MGHADFPDGVLQGVRYRPQRKIGEPVLIDLLQRDRLDGAEFRFHGFQGYLKKFWFIVKSLVMNLGKNSRLRLEADGWTWE